MKYQHILNGKLLFETNNLSEFYNYLCTNEKAKQCKNSILFNLLEQSNGYICNMATAQPKELDWTDL